MNDYLLKAKELIAIKSGLEIEEVKDDLYFEDDLNVGELELIEILTDLEDEFEIKLIEKKDEIETVATLIELLEDQID